MEALQARSTAVIWSREATAARSLRWGNGERRRRAEGSRAKRDHPAEQRIVRSAGGEQAYIALAGRQSAATSALSNGRGIHGGADLRLVTPQQSSQRQQPRPLFATSRPLSELMVPRAAQRLPPTAPENEGEAQPNEANSVQCSKMRSVVEHVMLFRMDPNLPLEQEQDFLDHMYTLQYHYRHILSVSLGRVFSRASDGYTHGVLVRLPDKQRLSEFLSHAALNDVIQKHVDPFCLARFSLSFEAQVLDSLESVFRRGEDFQSGVEHLVFLRPKPGATEAQKQELMGALLLLPRKVGQSVVQLTAGNVLTGVDPETGFACALLARLPSEEDLALFNRHPAHREVIRKHLLPLAERILSVDFSVDPVGQERPV